MSTALRYPGVYIVEVPSGVRTITGVATSVTAFIGTCPRGATDTPVTINSFGDFERRFGGLAQDSMLSYAVRDFFLNRGSQAVVVRVHNGATAAAIDLLTGEAAPNDVLTLVAASEGAWGNHLSAVVDYNTKDAGSDDTLFNVTVFETIDGERVATETFRNVSLVEASPGFLPRVLEQQSSLVRVETDGTGPLIPQDGSGLPARPLPLSPPTPSQAQGGGDGSTPGPTQYIGSRNQKTGIFALAKQDLFNLLCIPPPRRGGNTHPSVWATALTYCVERRAFLIVDPDNEWGLRAETAVESAIAGLGSLALSGKDARNAALYFPRLLESDPLLDNAIDTFVPCGVVAGIMARTDAERGVWKAPAGLDASLNGVRGLQVNLTDDENGDLNPLAVNCLRSFPVNGRVVWGARTMRGADQQADEYKYVPVRRTVLFLEESLYRGTQWVVFEPNDEPLWAQIRLNVGAFMQSLFRQGAFQGQTPREAYLVKCDKETTTQNDIDRGIVNILVGFAPLKPAEFVIIRIQQLAGQIEV
jgi:phage tail sheath protein FI